MNEGLLSSIKDFHVLGFPCVSLSHAGTKLRLLISNRADKRHNTLVQSADILFILLEVKCQAGFVSVILCKFGVA